MSQAVIGEHTIEIGCQACKLWIVREMDSGEYLKSFDFRGSKGFCDLKEGTGFLAAAEKATKLGQCRRVGTIET